MRMVILIDGKDDDEEEEVEETSSRKKKMLKMMIMSLLSRWSWFDYDSIDDTDKDSKIKNPETQN